MYITPKNSDKNTFYLLFFLRVLLSEKETISKEFESKSLNLKELERLFSAIGQRVISRDSIYSFKSTGAFIAVLNIESGTEVLLARLETVVSGSYRTVLSVVIGNAMSDCYGSLDCDWSILITALFCSDL